MSIPEACFSGRSHGEMEGHKAVRGLSRALFCRAASQNGLRGSPSSWHGEQSCEWTTVWDTYPLLMSLAQTQAREGRAVARCRRGRWEADTRVTACGAHLAHRTRAHGSHRASVARIGNIYIPHTKESPISAHPRLSNRESGRQN